MNTKNTIRVKVNQDHYHIESKIFSGGEIHVDISHLPTGCNDYSIKARLQSSEDIMHLMLLCDAMHNRYPDVAGTIVIPYLPYARQDRMCAGGQHFGLQVMCDMLSDVKQKNLVVYDLHSPVAYMLLSGYFEKVTNITQSEIIGKHNGLHAALMCHDMRLVAPDHGAKGKTEQLGVQYGMKPIYGSKLRDSSTGKLTGFDVDCADIQGEDLLIVDDILDGGGTFLGLAKVLKERNAGSISLFVTHGIFANGLAPFAGLIDHIYTSDSFTSGVFLNDEVKLTVIKI